MGEEEKQEVLDVIRNVLAEHANDNYVRSVLGPVSRRRKPGGILVEDELLVDTEGPSKPAILKTEPPTTKTRTECQAFVLQFAKQTSDGRHVEKPYLDQREIDRLFIKRDEDQIQKNVNSKKSLISTMIEESGVAKEEPLFYEYAQFESTSTFDSRLIKIVYPFAEKSFEEDITKNLAIRVKRITTVKQFIGLSLYNYILKGWRPTPKPDIRRYNLYLADDLDSYDLDLPHLDKNRTLSDVDFDLLALIEEPDFKVLEVENKYMINVFFIDGTLIDFELDGLENTIGWLKREALNRRSQMRKDKGIQKSQNLDQSLLNYKIEPIDKPNKPLNEEEPIAATGALSFIVIRENSSRGHFVPPKSPMSPTRVNPRSASSNHFEFLDQSMEQSSSSTPLFMETKITNESVKSNGHFTNSTLSDQTTSTLGIGKVIDEYFVERSFKLKGNLNAKLTLREDCITLFPIEDKKKNHSNEKNILISWDLIGGVDYVEKSSTKRILRIIWLPMKKEMSTDQNLFFQYLDYLRAHNIEPEKKHHKRGFSLTGSSSAMSLFSLQRKTQSTHAKLTKSESTQSNFNDLITDKDLEKYPEEVLNFDVRELIKAYENISWKNISIETNVDQAWKIGTKINEILSLRNSTTQEVYRNSLGGDLKPSVAADRAFNLKGTLNAVQSVHGGNSTKEELHKRRFSLKPMLTRMLSRND